PTLGRFLSPDPTVPSERAVGLNRYAYAGNDPINHVDIDGLGFWSMFRSLAESIGWRMAMMIPGYGWVVRIAQAAVYAIQAGLNGGFGAAMRSLAVNGIGDAVGHYVSPSITSGMGKSAAFATERAISFGTGFATGLIAGASIGSSMMDSGLGQAASFA